MGVAEDHIGVAQAETVGHLAHRTQPRAAQLLGGDVGPQRPQPGAVERRHGEWERAREGEPAQLAGSSPNAAITTPAST